MNHVQKKKKNKDKDGIRDDKMYNQVAFMYNMDGGGSYDQRCITKLVRNFRSHAELLTVPKQLFYNNELEACADQMQVESCLNFEGLPAEAKRNKVPMIFHGVIGQDLKEESSPSFFNIEEVVIVADYIKKLLEMKSNKVIKLFIIM